MSEDADFEQIEADLLGGDQLRRQERVHSHPNRYLIRLNESFRTEVACPDILPIPTAENGSSIVDNLQKMLQDQVKGVEDLREDTAEAKDMQNIFTVIIYEMDIERVRFSLARYLRARLVKIERQMFAISQDERLLTRLSDQERVFLNGLLDLHSSYFDETIYRNPLTEECQHLLKQGTHGIKGCQQLLREHCRANLDTHVVCLPKDDFHSSAGNIKFSEDEVKIVNYRYIADDVAAGRASLL